MSEEKSGGLLIGWATADLTPERPVVIAGQRHIRVSEGVMDPVTATVLVLESKAEGAKVEQAVLVSCDLVCISNELRDAVREKVRDKVPGVDPGQVVLNATHTHTAPMTRTGKWRGMDLGVDVMPAGEYVNLIAGRIADAVAQAWKDRAPQGISYGLGQAVVGHNRLACSFDGKSTMYGKTDRPDFSHVEGYEDHSVNVLATWSRERRLTGLVVNVACPSQVSEGEFQISADYWHDVRVELRRRFGGDLFVLPQCSAAGDQSPHLLLNRAAEERMRKLAGISERQAIAVRIADAVSSAMPVLQQSIEADPRFVHRAGTVELPRRALGKAEADNAAAEARRCRAKYEELRAGLIAKPELKKEPRWYVPASSAYGLAEWNELVAARLELQKSQPRVPVEVHVLLLGDVAFATNPFEYYLDYGCQIKARSRAVQTFVVQLAGEGTYLPSARATAGGSYGAVPASTIVGPEGGRELARRTVELIDGLWKRK